MFGVCFYMDGTRVSGFVTDQRKSNGWAWSEESSPTSQRLVCLAYKTTVDKLSELKLHLTSEVMPKWQHLEAAVCWKTCYVDYFASFFFFFFMNTFVPAHWGPRLLKRFVHCSQSSSPGSLVREFTRARNKEISDINWGALTNDSKVESHCSPLPRGPGRLGSIKSLPTTSSVTHSTSDRALRASSPRAIGWMNFHNSPQ